MQTGIALRESFASCTISKRAQQQIHSRVGVYKGSRCQVKTNATPGLSVISFNGSSSSASASEGWTENAQLSAAITNLSAIARRGALDARKLQRKAARHLRSGSPLMAMSMAAPALPGSGIGDLLSNRVFMTGFTAWFLAQFAKIFTKRYKKGVWDVKAMFEPGGMPSSHSSLCAGITTAVALTQGLGSPMFAVCVAFSVIVMYDAMGVRQHAGKQAEVLNQMIIQLMDDHPVGDVKLKEVLGHTPRQVVCGATLGVIVGLLFPA